MAGTKRTMDKDAWMSMTKGGKRTSAYTKKTKKIPVDGSAKQGYAVKPSKGNPRARKNYIKGL